jgi:hypothetical protein
VRCGFDYLAEEPFGCPRVSFCAEHKVNRLSRRIDCAVEILPLTFDFDVGLLIQVMSATSLSKFQRLNCDRIAAPAPFYTGFQIILLLGRLERGQGMFTALLIKFEECPVSQP